MDLPEQYQDDFHHLCSPTGMVNADVKDDASPLSWSVKHEFNNVATKAPLHGINWRNDSGVTVPSNYKLVHFDEDDAASLRDIYQIMYLESEIEMVVRRLCAEYYMNCALWIKSMKFGLCVGFFYAH